MSVDQIITTARHFYGENKCWTGAGVQCKDGYCRIHKVGGTRMLHRIVYEKLAGKIPEGLVLDHLCRNRACFNPKHLEPVTIGTNNLRGVGAPALNARKTHCPNGHLLSPTNSLPSYRAKGIRSCRECKKAQHKKWYWKNGGTLSRYSTVEAKQKRAAQLKKAKDPNRPCEVPGCPNLGEANGLLNRRRWCWSHRQGTRREERLLAGTANL